MTGTRWLIALGSLLFSGVAQAQDTFTVAVLGAASSPAHNDDIRDVIMCSGRGVITRVDLFDAAASTPSANDLTSYGALLVYNEVPFANPIALGDTVAAFVEDGGGAVLAGSVFDAGLGLQGRFVTQGLSPFTGVGTAAAPGGNLLFTVLDNDFLWRQGPLDGHPILYGYTFFEGGTASYQVQGLQSIPQGERIANWGNFEPAIVAVEPAISGQGRIVGLNLMPFTNRVDPGSWDPFLAGGKVLDGSLRWTAGWVAAPDCQNTRIYQDLNCNDIDVSDEADIDNSSDECQGVTDPVSGLPYDNNDYYWDYFGSECLYPTDSYDADRDGLSAGTITITPAGGGKIWDTFVLSCDNCANVFNPHQYDTDCDTFGDLCDVCPTVDEMGQQTDLDGDCFGDLCDNCFDTPNSDQYDDDEDGAGNACDNCPGVANPFELDPNTGLPSQPDVDGDGAGDACDNCFMAPSLAMDETDRSNADQLDSDFDGWGDACDICPFDFDPEQPDSDNDGVGDACDTCPGFFSEDNTDQDGDGLGDACDNCILGPNSDQLDVDLDGYGDACDNCTNFGNPDQSDTDEDGRGDVCDNCVDVVNPEQEDADVDMVGDVCDNCLFRRNQDQEDRDSDGFGDDCDFCLFFPDEVNEDFDGDGHGDNCDNCPALVNVDQADDDEDGVGNACDTLSLRGGGEVKPPNEGCNTVPTSGSAAIWLLLLAGLRRRRAA